MYIYILENMHIIKGAHPNKIVYCLFGLNIHVFIYFSLLLSFCVVFMKERVNKFSRRCGSTHTLMCIVYVNRHKGEQVPLE